MISSRKEKLEYIAAHYMKAMWQKSYSVLSDAHEAEDAVQEAFIKIIAKIDLIEDVESQRAGAFCQVIARNTAIDMARRNGRMIPTEDVYLERNASGGEARQAGTTDWEANGSGQSDELSHDSQAPESRTTPPTGTRTAPSPEDIGRGSPERELIDREDAQRVLECIERLPESYREVLRLRCFEELSPEETAEILEINVNTVSIRLSRARAALKKELAAESG